jgi:hypothetical protein
VEPKLGAVQEKVAELAMGTQWPRVADWLRQHGLQGQEGALCLNNTVCVWATWPGTGGAVEVEMRFHTEKGLQKTTVRRKKDR